MAFGDCKRHHHKEFDAFENFNIPLGFLFRFGMLDGESSGPDEPQGDCSYHVIIQACSLNGP